MKFSKGLSAFAWFAIILSTPCAAQPAAPAAAPVVVRQASVEDPGHAPIPVAIWSPASGTTLPLIVISHGTGAGMTSHIDTAQALARAGFVVVAPMHPGDNFQDSGVIGRPDWFVDRSRHVSKVIDFMFSQWEGHERLVADRVGIFGFSAGATTALISIGGIPEPGRVAPHCAASPEFVCSIMAPQAGSAPGGPPRWTHDPRIAAAVIAAPGLGFAFEPAGLAEVRTPVQLWVGAEDETVPYASNAAIVRRLLPNAPDFHRVEGAVHLSFLAPCTPQTPPAICQDRPGFDRAAFHETFNQAVTTYFRLHLRDRVGSSQVSGR